MDQQDRFRSVAAAGMWGAVVLLLGGCANFFVKPDAPGTPTGPASGSDYLYVVNQTTNSLSQFSVAASALTAISGSPLSLANGLAAASVVVTRPNTYVYVGGNGAIECYSVGTNGGLTAVPTGGGAATANFVAMDVSPDGQWLLALDSLTLTAYVFKINTTSGALTLNATSVFAVPGSGAAVSKSIRFAAGGGFVAVALGSGGDVLFTFNTTTGVLAQSATVSLAAGYSDNGLQFDSTNGFLFVARGGPTAGSSGIAAYTVSATGVLASAGPQVASGNIPQGLLLDGTGKFLYSANRGDSTVSGYSVSGGTLTALPSSPFGSGLSVIALAADSSAKYLVAAAPGGGSDLTLYSFDALTAGKLDAVAVSPSGTDPAGSVALAATH